MIKLTSILKGNISKPTEIGKDDWSKQQGVFRDDSAFRKLAEMHDDDREKEKKQANAWKFGTYISSFAFIISLGWGMYGATRDHMQTKFVLVDKRSGDYEEVEANGNVTPPDVMMARELNWIGKCGFGASVDNVDLADCKIYRDKTFIGNANRKLNLWLDIVSKESKQRIARVISRKQADNDMVWDTRYHVAAWDGPNPIRQYNLDVKIVFEYRQPTMGILFGDSTGLFVKDIQIDEESS